MFISKATSEDDEFVLWLAPRLEAAGYAVFADILSRYRGDGFRVRSALAMITQEGVSRADSRCWAVAPSTAASQAGVECLPAIAGMK